MRFDLLDDFIVDRSPDILANNRPELLVGNFDAQL
jgi:hypothetical protein